MFRMQDEISMGFDRLIAMASEVDKRRKSAENSPVQVTIKTLLTCMQFIFLACNWGLVKDGTSPRKVASDLRLPESQDSMAKKFKVAQKYLAQ